MQSLNHRDQLVFLRYLQTHYYLLSRNNSRFHIIIAWCLLVCHGLYDHNDTGQILILNNNQIPYDKNNLPWRKSDSESKWIPASLYLFGNEMVQKFKIYLDIFYELTFNNKCFCPAKLTDEGICLISTDEDNSIEKCFTLASTFIVELSLSDYEMLESFKYPGLFIQNDNRFAFCGPVTLAIALHHSPIDYMCKARVMRDDNCIDVNLLWRHAQEKIFEGFQQIIPKYKLIDHITVELTSIKRSDKTVSKVYNFCDSGLVDDDNNKSPYVSSMGSIAFIVSSYFYLYIYIYVFRYLVKIYYRSS